MGTRIASVWGIKVHGVWQRNEVSGAISQAMHDVAGKAERNDPSWESDAVALGINLGCTLVAGRSIVDSGAA